MKGRAYQRTPGRGHPWTIVYDAHDAPTGAGSPSQPGGPGGPASRRPPGDGGLDQHRDPPVPGRHRW